MPPWQGGDDSGPTRGAVSTPPTHPRSSPLIFITAKFPVKPEHADAWPELSREFTQACRAEEGCLWFD